MKTLIIAVVIVIGMGVAVNIPFTAEVIQGEREEIMIEVNLEWIGEEDEEAIQAYLDVKQRKALKDKLNALEASFGSSTAIYEAEKESYEVERIRLQKEIGSY